MTQRNIHPDINNLLINDTPHLLFHLVKFERPGSNNGYAYFTDATIDITFLDPYTQVADKYIANKLKSIGSINETIVAKASNLSLTLSADTIGSIVDSAVLSFTTNFSFTGVVDFAEAGFRSGDKILVGSIECTISGFTNDNKTVTVLEDSFGASVPGTYNISLNSQEITAMYTNTSYVNREVLIYKAYMDLDGNIVGTPILAFKGLVTSGKLNESAESTSSVNWTLASHWGDFIRVQGRITSDEAHRALDPSGVPDEGSLIRPEYSTDKGFLHADKSVSVISTYNRQETYYKFKRAWHGLGGKMVSKTRTVQEEVDLNFNLAAKYIPLVYGVRKIDAIPIFVDTDSTKTNEVYVAYALSEGEIAGIQDIYIEDQPLVCLDTGDYNTRDKDIANPAVEVYCYGRADKGYIIQGQATAAASSSLNPLAELVADAEYTETETFLSGGRQIFSAYKDTYDGVTGELLERFSASSYTRRDSGGTRQWQKNAVWSSITTQIASATERYRVPTYQANSFYIQVNDPNWEIRALRRDNSVDTLVETYATSAEANAALAATSAPYGDTYGLIQGSFLELSHPVPITLTTYMGKPFQVSDIQLTSKAANKSFKVQNTTYADLPAADYWGTNHNLMDTAYVVAKITIPPGETTIPSLDFTVKGKLLECYNYDGSCAPVDTANNSTYDTYKLNDSVEIFELVDDSDGIGYFVKSTSINNIPPAYNSFEDVSVSLTTGSGVSTISTDFPRTGASSLKVTPSAPNCYTVLSSSSIGYNIKITPETKHVFSFYTYQSSGSLVTGQCHLRTSVAGAYYSFPFSVSSLGVWERHEFLVDLSSDESDYCNLRLDNDNNVSTIYFDDVMLEEKAALPASAFVAAGSTTTKIKDRFILHTGDGIQEGRFIFDEDFSSYPMYQMSKSPGVDQYSFGNYTRARDYRATTNPSFQLLDYLSNERYGKGLNANFSDDTSLSDINLDSFITAAQDCDTRSDITIVTTTNATADVGNYLIFDNLGLFSFKGKIVSSIYIAPNVYETVLTDCRGKLGHKWNDWNEFKAGEVLWLDGVARSCTVDGVYSTFTAVGSVITALTLDIEDSATTYSVNIDSAVLDSAAGNPIVRALTSGTSFTSSGYTIYDSDDVKYWKYLGWDSHEQRWATRHQLNQIVRTDQPLFDNVVNMLEQFNGMLRYSNGQYALDIKKQSSPALLDIYHSFSEDDIVGTLQVSDNASKENFNSISANIVDPQNKFEARSVSFFNSTYLAEDKGVQKQGQLNTEGITNYYNARFNTKQDLDSSRFKKIINFTSIPKAYLVLPGSIIYMTYARFGWVDKQFRITSANDKADGLVSITAEEHDDVIYAIPNVSTAPDPTTSVFTQSLLAAPTALVASNTVIGAVALSWVNDVAFNPSQHSVQILSASTDDILAASVVGTSVGSDIIVNIDTSAGSVVSRYYWARYAMLSTSSVTGKEKLTYSPTYPAVNGIVGAALALGADATITVSSTNETQNLYTSLTNVVDYSGSGTSIYVYDGSDALTYEVGVGFPTAAGAFRVEPVSSVALTIGTISDGGGYALVADHSALAATSDSVDITYTLKINNNTGIQIIKTTKQRLTKVLEGSYWEANPTISAFNFGSVRGNLSSAELATFAGVNFDVKRVSAAYTYDGSAPYGVDTYRYEIVENDIRTSVDALGVITIVAGSGTDIDILEATTDANIFVNIVDNNTGLTVATEVITFTKTIIGTNWDTSVSTSSFTFNSTLVATISDEDLIAFSTSPIIGLNGFTYPYDDAGALLSDSYRIGTITASPAGSAIPLDTAGVISITGGTLQSDKLVRSAELAIQIIDNYDASTITTLYVKLFKSVDSIELMQSVNSAFVDAAPEGHWDFESTTDGWTATEATLANIGLGIVELKATGANPEIFSPSTLSIDGGSYRYVIARIKKITGLWVGELSYVTSGQTYDPVYSKSITEPIYGSDGWGYAIWDMHTIAVGTEDWSLNTIESLKLGLTDDILMEYDIDWISVGRRSIAASSGEVKSLRTTVEDPTTGVVATAGALELLETRVSTAEGELDIAQAQYAVKLDVNGFLSGFGLVATAVGTESYSQFYVNADEFAMVHSEGTSYVVTSATKQASPTIRFATSNTTNVVVGGRIVVSGFTNEILNGSHKVLGIGTNSYIDVTFTASRYAAAANETATAKYKAASAPFKVVGGITYIDAARISNDIQSTVFSSTEGWRIDLNGTANFRKILIGASGSETDEEGIINDNIVIGGRNLLPIYWLSSVITILTPASFQCSNWDTTWMDATQTLSQFKQSTGYTISGTITLDALGNTGAGVQNEAIQITLYDDVLLNQITLVGSLGDFLTNIGDTHTFSVQFNTPADMSNRKLLSYTRRYNDTSNDTVTYTNLKIEVGNKATDWTPAPEDPVTDTIIGTSSNMVKNSEFSTGIGSWVIGNNPTGGTDYVGPGLDYGGVLFVPIGSHQIGFSRGPVTGAGILEVGNTDKIAVVGGQRYEASGYVAGHRSNSSLVLYSYDSADVELSNHVYDAAPSLGGQLLSVWSRVGGFIIAEPTAAYFTISLRGGTETSANPYTWGTRFFVGEATAGQTELSRWGEGGTTADITGDNTAADTLLVAGETAANVKSGAARATTGLDTLGNVQRAVIGAKLPLASAVTLETGFNLTEDYLGWHNGTTWDTYIGSNGNFVFKGDSNNYIDWNVTTTDTLTIAGNLVAGNISGVSITGSTLQTSSSGQRIEISSVDNEAHFYGDSGAGLEELATIGMPGPGSTLAIGTFGSQTFGNPKYGVLGLSYSGIAVRGISTSLTGVRGDSTTSFGVYGISDSLAGVRAISTSNYGAYCTSSTNFAIYADSVSSTAGYFNGTSGIQVRSKLSNVGGQIEITPSTAAGAPTHVALKGTIYMDSNTVLYRNTNGSTTWVLV